MSLRPAISITQSMLSNGIRPTMFGSPSGNSVTWYWVIDMAGRKLIGNPEHGGELLHEEFY